MVKKERNQEIDIMKGLLTLAMILCHCLQFFGKEDAGIEKDPGKCESTSRPFPVSCSVLALCAVWLIFRGTQGVESSICFGI